MYTSLTSMLYHVCNYGRYSRCHSWYSSIIQLMLIWFPVISKLVQYMPGNKKYVGSIHHLKSYIYIYQNFRLLFM